MMEAGPPQSTRQGETANHRKLLRSNAVVVNVAGKGAPECVRYELRRRT
jgi:hypothetical protein